VSIFSKLKECLAFSTPFRTTKKIKFNGVMIGRKVYHRYEPISGIIIECNEATELCASKGIVRIQKIGCKDDALFMDWKEFSYDWVFSYEDSFFNNQVE